jgi:hypothetical protein
MVAARVLMVSPVPACAAAHAGVPPAAAADAELGFAGEIESLREQIVDWVRHCSAEIFPPPDNFLLLSRHASGVDPGQDRKIGTGFPDH